jgi:hypothetical protein
VQYKWLALTVTTIGVLMVGIMSFTAQYDLITKILVAVNPQTIKVSEKALFLASLKNTYLTFAIVNTLALIPAAIGDRIKKAVGTLSVGE